MEQKSKKWPKMTENSLSLCISGTVPHMIVFLVHMCKMMISPAIFFIFFKSLTFWIFQSSSINGKEILRCAPPSSHVSDFFLFISLFQCFNGSNYKHLKFSILNRSRCSDAWQRNCGLAHWCHFHRLLCKKFEQYKSLFTLIEVVSRDGFQEISRILIKLVRNKWLETNDCQY